MHNDVLGQRLARLDLSLLATIYAPGSRGDPASLLALHCAARSVHGAFAYLEIGSHLGASLQSFVADPRCVAITSIDPRPSSQPDDALGVAYYPGNSTERMLEGLARVPGADLTKLRTVEKSAEDVHADEIHGAPRLCFIDGEHTHRAALRDARFCRRVLGDQGAIVFHDRRIVVPAIRDLLRELEADSVVYCAYPLPGELFVVELGAPRLLDTAVLKRRRSLVSRRLWVAATGDGRSSRSSTRVTSILASEARARRGAQRMKRLAQRLRRGGWRSPRSR